MNDKEYKTAAEVLAQVCRYKSVEEMDDNDDIEVAEALEAMHLYAVQFKPKAGEVERLEKIFVAVSVKNRLPEKPIRPLGGQQVNHIQRDYGVEKVVLLDSSKGFGEMSIFSFHYLSKKWYAEWDCRSGIVDETKHKDVTDVVTHWLDEDNCLSKAKEVKESDMEALQNRIRILERLLDKCRPDSDKQLDLNEVK